ncbi:FG-GAP-like repeat-containing protein [Streptomyces sp. NPDC054796]
MRTRTRTRTQRRTRSAAAVGLAAALTGGFALTALTAGTAGAAAPGAQAAQQVREDFNGDGYQDLAIGAPGTYGQDSSAGYVAVVYGSPTGLDPATRTVLGQDSPGVPGAAERGDLFGHRLVARDLDGDGLTDLAVSSPGESRANPVGAGSATVLWGARSGLSGQGSVVVDPGEDETYGVGDDLTGGDFDGDGAQDLLMFRGDARGYTVLRGPFTRAGAPASEEAVELTTGDSYVLSLAAGDVTGDGADDLFVLQSFEEMGRGTRFFAGGDDGLTARGTLLPSAATGAVGDFDKDGFGDYAYRQVPGGVVENLPYDSGTVKVLYGTASGPGTRTATFTQATAGVPGTSEANDQFGATLSAGDVNGDGYDDLAAGVPFEAIGTKKAAGSTVLLRGAKAGLTGTGAQAFHQDSAGVGGVAEAGDRFGGAVRLLDSSGDGKAGLAVSAPGENGGNGAVWSLRGASGGLTATGSRAFGPGALGAPATTARFGASFAGPAYAPLWEPS